MGLRGISAEDPQVWRITAERQAAQKIKGMKLSGVARKGVRLDTAANKSWSRREAN